VSLYQKVGYDPVKDFQPISLLATLPFVLVVHAGFAPRNVKELVALAKAKPGSINYASAGNGGPTHLAGALFRSSAAIDIVHVPYKGNSAALTELAGGQVQMMFSNMLTAMPHVRSGRLRALGVSTAKRSPQAPDLPTVAESGVPGFDVTPWYGVLAPAGLPAPLVAKWNREIVRIVPLPDMRERFVAQGVDLASSTPAEFSALIKSGRMPLASSCSRSAPAAMSCAAMSSSPSRAA
jgi:tripartite-type tricarboxylate transporter receptor subunit TctC